MTMTRLQIIHDRFCVNGKLTYSEYPDCPAQYKGLLMNARFIQGIFDDKNGIEKYQRFGREFDPEKNTSALIASLPAWYEKGLRAITVGFQGGGPCFTISNDRICNAAFSEDGLSIDIVYLERMKKIILAADKIGMVVIVSYFYGAQTRFLKDDEAVINAVKTASKWLRQEGFTNVIIEIANEHNEGNYFIHPILYDGKGVIRLMEIARKESGGMPVGCSDLSTKYEHSVAEASDIIFIHGNNQSRQAFYQTIKMAKSIRPIRPIVCNEDSQSLSQMQVALDEGVSWGYYNNFTKQEPPTDWGITKGEDEFFATRLAISLGIEKDIPDLENRFYLQGLEKNNTYDGKRWVRLASLYPEQIHKVDFWRNGKLYETAYNVPFSIKYGNNWNQGAIEDIEQGEAWEAIVTLVDSKIVKLKIAFQG